MSTVANNKKQELIELLHSVKTDERYAARYYENVDYAEYDALNGSMIMPNIFDNLLDELERLPTIVEFIEQCLIESEYYFTRADKLNKKGERWLKVWVDGQQKWHNFEWNDRLIKAVTARAARSYPSFTAEYTTKLMIEHVYENARVINNNYVDRLLGVDLVVVDENDRVYYLHVLRNSALSFKYFNQKKTKQGSIWHNNKRYTYDREYTSAHNVITYDTRSQNSEDKDYIVVNNVVFITAKQIRRAMLEVDSERLNDSKLKDISEYLMINNIINESIV